MDLFEDYDLLPEELKAVCGHWQEKAAHLGLDYNDCKAFQEECEAIGYTFDYGLDAEPFDLRPMNIEKQDFYTNQDQTPAAITNALNWYAKYITPLTRAYKDFVKEMENTSPEIFFHDGERKFSDREKKFMQIHSQKNRGTDNEADKQKFLSDVWAKELSKKTELSSGLTYTQIDEKQAHHYRIFEAELKRSGMDSVARPYETNWDENMISASDLPEGWMWNDYDDGSGSLRSPDGHSYYSYDLQTQECRSPYGNNEWISMKDFYDVPKSLDEFKRDAEKDLKESAAQNNLSPKLSEEEKRNLLNYRILKKENEFILDNLEITADQRKAYAEQEEFGTTDGDYTLTEHQLDKIPDVIEGHVMSKNDKYELAYGVLERTLYGVSYELLESGEILNIYMDEDAFPQYRILTTNDIKFNNQNPNMMETQKDFDQVQYLKDQMKYLGFGEGEQLHKDLEKGINAKEQQFEIKTGSDKASPGNHVDFTLKFNKTERGGIFLNSYQATLTNENNEERSHNFPVSRESSFTAKEAINLLEGRSVKIEFLNPKTDQVEPAFVQFDFNQPKTDKGNYLFQNFYKKYGVDTDKIADKAGLIFDKPEWKETAIKSLEKGNIVKVKFKQEDSVIEGKAILDPQNRNLKLYDNDMNRLNSNKPLEGLEQDNKHEKNNVKEQSIKR